MAQKNTWTLNELAEIEGFNVELFRLKAKFEGLSLSDDSPVSLEQIKKFDPSLAATLKVNSSSNEITATSASSPQKDDSQQENISAANNSVDKQANLELGKTTPIQVNSATRV